MNKIAQDAVNTIRFLAADAVQNANSGHPGFPMGAAAIAYAIWARNMRINPIDPQWFNRDRFILSGGHGSAMLYSLLVLFGILRMEDLQQFRSLGSRTPGHPEYGLTPGVDATTGPLGQGFANGVGMAIAEKHLAAEFNRPGHKVIDHYTYAIVTDGDLMEGISSEAASLAGHLQLGKLIYCYDDNHITIDGTTDLTFTEDVEMRFQAYGWQVLRVENAMDADTVDAAIQEAKLDPRPSLIICRTHIGFGSPLHQDKTSSHGSPLGVDDLANAKKKLDWPIKPDFYVPLEVADHFKQLADNGSQAEQLWQASLQSYAQEYPELAAELRRRMAGKLPAAWDDGLDGSISTSKPMPTRIASGFVLNALSQKLPELMGGSADLTSSNNVNIKSQPRFSADTPVGKNLHFGVREHAMAAIANGMAYHGGVLPFYATYLVFTDYCRPALRVAALSGLHTLAIMTHDSFYVGQDGPTHQPVEHLASLRLIPNLVVIRPGDAAETLAAWKVAVQLKKKPVVFALSRQDMPQIDRTKYASAVGLQRGAYVLADLGPQPPQIILMASGSELGLIVVAGERLAAEGVGIRLVSFPCWELFEAQSADYKQSVLPEEIRLRISVEAGTTTGWERWVGLQGHSIGLNQFGASAKPNELSEVYGFTPERIVQDAKNLLAKIAY